MRRETSDLIGSGLLLAALVIGLVATLVPTPGAGAATTVAAGPVAAATADPVARGRMLFHIKGCVSCHSLTGEPGANGFACPDLTGLFVRAGTREPGVSAQDYIRESIRTPSAFIVPGYGATFGMPDLGLSDAEIDDLIAYFIATTQEP